MSSGHDCFSCQYDGVIATHYDVLGISRDAPPELVRSAYRDRARQQHPDRWPAGNVDAMSEVNEAYRVLSDPRRRLEYDRSLGLRRTGSAVPSPTPPEPDFDAVDRITSTPVPPSRLMPSGPAKVPWRMMGIVAAFGATVVLVGSAFNDPPASETPDGIIRIGSCVDIQQNNMVREVACVGSEVDEVVQYVIPTDGTCPSGLGGYLDRLGQVKACLEFD